MVISFLFYSCTQLQDTSDNTVVTARDTAEISVTGSPPADSISQHPESTLHATTKKTVLNKKRIRREYLRSAETPTDAHFNGKPLIRQLNLALPVLQIFPDTLMHLAKDYYAGYVHLFPVSVQDDFERGVSTERIHYPKLIIEFQLFGSEYESKPYLVKLISVKKESDGTLKIE